MGMKTTEVCRAVKLDRSQLNSAITQNLLMIPLGRQGVRRLWEEDDIVALWVLAEALRVGMTLRAAAAVFNQVLPFAKVGEVNDERPYVVCVPGRPAIVSDRPGPPAGSGMTMSFNVMAIRRMVRGLQ